MIDKKEALKVMTHVRGNLAECGESFSRLWDRSIHHTSLDGTYPRSAAYHVRHLSSHFLLTMPFDTVVLNDGSRVRSSPSILHLSLTEAHSFRPLHLELDPSG